MKTTVAISPVVVKATPPERDSLQKKTSSASEIKQKSDGEDSPSSAEEMLEEQEETVDELQHTQSGNENIEEQKQAVSTFKFIDLGDSKLIVLEQNTVIYLHGVVRITVVRGCVDVLGYVISSGSKSVDLFSPKGTSFLYIRPLQSTVSTNIYTSFAQNEEIVNFIEQQTYDSCIILCETVENSDISYIEKHIAQQIYPKQDNSLRYVFEEHPVNWNVVTVSSDWDNICDTVSPHCKVFLCGGKGVGKSTFLRYAINRLLVKYAKIRVVDLDPGQPEFTISGCVSVHTITEPVFGPNYTHIRKPEKQAHTNYIISRYNHHVLGVFFCLMLTSPTIQKNTYTPYENYYLSTDLQTNYQHFSTTWVLLLELG